MTSEARFHNGRDGGCLLLDTKGGDEDTNVLHARDLGETLGIPSGVKHGPLK
jgi:hypothetical protein